MESRSVFHERKRAFTLYALGLAAVIGVAAVVFGYAVMR
jgi:hypothetical protein